MNMVQSSHNEQYSSGEVAALFPGRYALIFCPTLLDKLLFPDQSVVIFCPTLFKVELLFPDQSVLILSRIT